MSDSGRVGWRYLPKIVMSELYIYSGSWVTLRGRAILVSVRSRGSARDRAGPLCATLRALCGRDHPSWPRSPGDAQRPRRAKGWRWRRARAIGSAGERLVHTEEVTGSIPVSPTTKPAAGRRLPARDGGPRGRGQRAGRPSKDDSARERAGARHRQSARSFSAARSRPDPCRLGSR